MKYSTLLLCLLLSAIPVYSQTVFDVNSTRDEPDVNPGDGTCLTVLGFCTLRAAIDEANAAPNGANPDKILFTSTPIIAGSAIIDIVGDALPAITDPVEIDGTTAAGDVIIDGTSATYPGSVITSSGLILGAGSDGSKIRGLFIGNFPWYGVYVISSGNSIISNSIGLLPDGSDFGNDKVGVYLSGDDNSVGKPDKGNVIGYNGSAGIHITNGENNILRGNYIGTDESGQDMGNYWLNGYEFAAGITVFADNNTIGGTLEGMGNTIGFNYKSGIFLYGANNVVRGNLIGVNDAGQDVGNAYRGILVGVDGENNTIGGALEGMGNTIGFNGYGILLWGPANKIQGNFIGTNENGDDIGNEHAGIASTSDHAENNVIGYGKNATIPPQFSNLKANVIAFNGIGIRIGNGITSAYDPNYIAIRGNSIYSNDSLGIDLGTEGMLLNDEGDADEGANTYLNYPDVSRAFYRAGSNELVVEYSLSTDSTINTYPLLVDIYLADNAASGEGKTYIGTDVYTTQDFGAVYTIDADSITWASTDYVVLTTTDADGNTSEFSPPAGELDPAGAMPTVSVDSTPNKQGAPQPGNTHLASARTPLISTYPNPFNPQTTVSIELPTPTQAHITVHDLLGRQVALLHKGKLAGSSTFVFDGSHLPSGIYLLRVNAGTYVETMRMTLIK